MTQNTQTPQPCPHTETYVAVRHVSGICLRKCKKCGQKVN